MPPQQTPPVTNVPQAGTALPVSERSFPTPLVAAGLAFVLAIGGLIYWFGGASAPAQPPKVIKIGIMRYVQQLSQVEDGFYKGMRDLGYQEGVNVEYIVAPYGDSPEVMQGIATDLINQGVDLVYANTSVAAMGTFKAAKAAGRIDLPIVFTHGLSPEEVGLVDNLRSSGNNLTGVAVDFIEVTEKKLEFLRQIDPTIKRIGYIDSTQVDPATRFMLRELPKALAKFGMEPVPIPVKNSVGPKADAEVAKVAASVKQGEIDALFSMPGPVSNKPPTPQVLADMAKRLKVPMVGLLDPQVTVNGALFTYAHDLFAMGEQTAVIVDKVLKSAKPSDIPIEFPKKNSLTINLATAREIGVIIPESMLFIAQTKVGE